MLDTLSQPGLLSMMSHWHDAGHALLAVARGSEEFVTELRDLPEGWLGVAGAALLALLCGAAVWMYRREGRSGVSPRLRHTLAVVRCAVIVTLALILLDPIRVRILRKWIDSYTIVLVDTSSSMDLADTYRDEATRRRVANLMEGAGGGTAESGSVQHLDPIKRSDIVATILGQNDRAFLRGLAVNNRVKLYTFDAEPQPRATVRADWESSGTGSTGGGAGDQTGGLSDASSASVLSVDQVQLGYPGIGPATNLERALRRSVESLGSAPIAAVVALTDGGFNQGASVEELARYALDRNIPIHTIGIGDPAPPRNVRVAEVLAPENAFQNDPFPISARITAEGLDGETLRVLLHEYDPNRGGEGRVVDAKTITVGPGGAVEEVSFQREQERVGRFVYTVEVPVLEHETVVDDNSRQTTVNVIDARTRVLLVAGGPSWEYRFVTRLLERDATFDLSCWLQSADLNAVRDGDTVIDHFPMLAEELFAYDVVILMDPQPDDLTGEWCSLLDAFVTEHGGGVLYQVARSYTPAAIRLSALEPIRAMLPVTLDPEADLILNQIGHYQVSPSPLLIPDSAFDHPVMRAGETATDTRLVWRGMGDIYWHYPVLREKPAATVLMRHGHGRMRNSYGGHVLAAVQFVGAGRVGFLGFDSTWRWRRNQVDLFDRFWVQHVRYLSEGKLLGGGKRGLILTERDQYSIGESVTVTARLFDTRYEPLAASEVRARYFIEGERRELALVAQRDRPGWFEGRFIPDRGGLYRISLNLPGNTPDETVEVVREIRASRPNIEIMRPQMARADLIALSEGSYGGRYFEVDEALELPDLIPDLHAEIPIRSRPTTLWDNGWMLALLVALLSVEWGLRKWNRLL